jgi:hypothetical protein
MSISMPNNHDVAFNKNALLRSATMKLSITAGNVFGGKDEYQKTLDKVSTLVNNSALAQPFSLSTARAVATLQYDALAVLGSIGGVIPHNCSDKILQVCCGIHSFGVILCNLNFYLLTCHDVLAPFQRIYPTHSSISYQWIIGHCFLLGLRRFKISELP